MLVIITNIPTPYRTSFFNVLNHELQKMEIGFHVIYCAKTEPRRFWKFEEEENNYRYSFLKGFHPEFRNFYPHFNLGLKKKLKSLNPTWILMAGSWNAPSVINTIIYNKTLKSRLIFWSEGHLQAQRSKSRIIDSFRKYVFKKIDAFVVPNNKSKDYIRLYNNACEIGMLPNTIDEEFFNIRDLNKNEIRKQLDIPDDALVITLVSTLSDRKGVFEFINGYNLLSIEQKRKLFIQQVGQGELYENLKTYKESNNLLNYRILGQKTQSEVRNLLAASDLFALPTKLDPNPLTPIEASFLKKALILSNNAGNVDELLMANNKNGFALEEITKFEIHKILLKVLELSNDDIEKMGMFSYDNVSKNFTRLSASQNLIKFLKSLI